MDQRTQLPGTCDGVAPPAHRSAPTSSAGSLPRAVCAAVPTLLNLTGGSLTKMHPGTARDLLVIEDDKGFVSSLTRLLEASPRQKFAVRATGTLAEALQTLATVQVDLILLDLSLPDSTGAETFRAVQAAAPDLPVIILSGLDDEDLAVRLVQEGAQDYFIKGDGDIHLLSRAIRYAIERKRSEQALRASERQLHALAERLQAVREEDRVCLARELHDRIGQDLAVLKMELYALAANLPEGADDPRGKARAIADSVTSTISAVREICSELRPQMLDDLGLVAALEWHAQQFSKRTGIQCSFSGDLPAKIDPARSVAVYRVVQEALTNVLRHAGATRVEICARARTDRLEVTIHDNGRGITSEEIEQGQSLGLLGMRERVHSFGGTFDISGSPGEGTRITVSLPLQTP